MFTFGLLCFTSFFTLINPLGAMPVFMTMTMELDEKERRKVARRASLVSFLIMMFFAISGDLLFRFFGISIDSLRIVGGIIFLIMGMDMLQARLVKTKGFLYLVCKPFTLFAKTTVIVTICTNVGRKLVDNSNNRNKSVKRDTEAKDSPFNQRLYRSFR